MKTVTINNTPIKMWVKVLDGNAWKEVDYMSRLPFLHSHIALMPDAHGGSGMPIGGVIATKGVLIPGAISPDAGCGMQAMKTSLKVSDIPVDVLRKGILRGIRKRVPLEAKHKTPQPEEYMPQGFDFDKLPIVKANYDQIRRNMGTLGGSNHFIELQKDPDGYLWAMIHTGSRGCGGYVFNYYAERAKVLNSKYYSIVPEESRLWFLPSGTPEFKGYWEELQYCLAFARCNRNRIMECIRESILEAIPEAQFEEPIDIHHNFAEWEEHFGEKVLVHRKGATRAGLDEIGIIPGSQGTCSYIVRGLGNPESFCSCSHGAGRLMSRSEATAILNVADEVAKMEAQGIIHAIRGRQDLEEAPGAYKNIDEVMENQKDLVEPIIKLEPIAVIKG